MGRTIGQVEKLYGVPQWRIRRLIVEGKIAEPRRIGIFRVFEDTDLPGVERALRSAGLLKNEAVTHGA